MTTDNSGNAAINAPVAAPLQIKAPGAEAIVRGIGHSLKGVPLEERLADPTLQVVDSNGVTQTNRAIEISATCLQPESPKEAAIRLVLPAGGNTIVLRGKNNTTGVSLVEVYNVP